VNNKVLVIRGLALITSHLKLDTFWHNMICMMISFEDSDVEHSPRYCVHQNKFRSEYIRSDNERISLGVVPWNCLYSPKSLFIFLWQPVGVVEMILAVKSNSVPLA
jgi:hypothetical protein